MTVAELVRALKDLPPDLPVVAAPRAFYGDVMSPALAPMLVLSARSEHPDYTTAGAGEPGAFRAVVV